MQRGHLEPQSALPQVATMPDNVAAEKPAFFLRTKLLPPRPAPTLLPRPRLVERLAANLAHPVTLVMANAGSGKTTLVSEFVRTHVSRFVWYQLDHTDADPAVFLGYIAHGIRQIIPDFGRVTFSYLQQSAAEVGLRPERAVDVLLNEVLDQVEQQVILVLDDYHHLGASNPVHAAVDRLIAYLPDVLHIVLISREMPPLQITRMRSQATLAVIGRNDLLFTDEETQSLFRQIFDLELTPEQLAEYRERTQGWITALQLVRQMAQRSPQLINPPAVDLSDVLRQSERDIFDYFAEEVFAAEEEHVRRLLLRLALLERIELEACARLHPDAACAALLPQLVRRNVFITVASDEHGHVQPEAQHEEYRLHPLFRSFLLRRFRSDVGRAGVAAEHARIADYFLSHERMELAISHLLAAEEFDRAAEVIAKNGAAWITSGALNSLAASVDVLPADALERHPRAIAYRAEAARLCGEYEAAQASLRRAAALLHARDDREGEAEALHSLATIARRRGDFTAAFDYLDRAMALVSELSAVRVKCGNTRGLCLVSLGQWIEAEREFRAALQAAEEQHDAHSALAARLIVHNLGLPPMMRGDFGEALRWLRRLLRDGQGSQSGSSASSAPPMPQEAAAHLNMARCYLYRGDLAACELHLDRALECCQLFNLTAMRAEVFEAYGNLHRERRDVARAVEAYERAARAYDEAGSDLPRHELLEEQAMLRLQTGDAVTARKLMDQLIAARRALQDEVGIQTATLARGRVLLAQGQSELATAELEPALGYFHQHGLYYYEAQCCLALALCALAAGREVPMVERLRRALDLAARFDYEYWLQREVAAHPYLFAASEVIELLPPEIREGLTNTHASSLTAPLSAPLAPTLPARISAVALVAQSSPMADLTVSMLGPVEIFRDPCRPFAADAWTTRRSRDILCFIASRRHRRASKDTIIDTFWGESDFESVARNFHPTISHIRKALNSNQPLKQNFLLYRDGDYMLNSDFSYAIDIEEFDRLLGEGEAARRAGRHEQCIAAYEAAVKLHRGEFMPGCYDEWVEEKRSYYQEQYLHMLEALVIAAQKTEEWPRSLHLAQQILRDDPFREDIHCLMMRAHAAQGNRVAVKEQYETLRTLLHKELGVEPAAETQKTYRNLLG
jgi:LuxR family maltose regulon positive regulatory protein